MSDAATNWIAPYVQNLPHNDWIGQLWVMNPGPNPTLATVRYYNVDGTDVTGEAEQIIPPFSCRLFEGAGREAPPENGWCHITSEHPVLPWGITAFRTNPPDGGEQEGFADMSFYRAGEIPFQIPKTVPHK